jgi:valyl-tRNA synthetase
VDRHRPRPENYAALAGKTIFSAKETVVELLRASGDLDGEPVKITHPVNFYEKGDKPLEVVTSRQWYIRNGGRDADKRERLINRGREIDFHPAFMRSRYENWIEGLNGDWLSPGSASSASRAGLVPLDADGEPGLREPDRPPVDSLPGRPGGRAGPRFDESARNQPNGFIGDQDVLDTWATSSLTPQIVGGWSRDEDLFSRVFPFDLRPQGHDIIRTWLFSTAVRADACRIRRRGATRRSPAGSWTRPQEDVQVQGQRGGPHRRARAVRRRRGALLGRLGEAWFRYRLRDQPDEDRAPACHQAA